MELCSLPVACSKRVARSQKQLIKAGSPFSSFPLLPLPPFPHLLAWPCPCQVFVLALTFLVLFLGNFLTTLKVVHAKLQKNRNKGKKP